MTLLTDPSSATRWTLALEAARPTRLGTVSRVIGDGFEIAGLDAAIGDMVIVETTKGPNAALVVGLRDGQVLASAYGELAGVRCGQLASATGGPPRLAVGQGLLGRVLDALGRPIDNGPELVAAGLIADLGVDLDEQMEVIGIGDPEGLLQGDLPFEDPRWGEGFLAEFGGRRFFGWSCQLESPAAEFELGGDTEALAVHAVDVFVGRQLDGN